MYVVAPVVYLVYRFFDRATPIEGWFHYNWAHFFFLLKYQTGFLVFFIGMYLALPPTKFVKVILFPAVGFLISGIWLNVNAQTNNEIWYSFSWVIYLAGCTLAITLFLALDKFCWMFFHQELGFKQRMDNITANYKAFPPEQALEMYKQAWLDYNKVISQQ